MEVALLGAGITPPQGQALHACIALNVHAPVAPVALITPGTAHNSLPCAPVTPQPAHPCSCWTWVPGPGQQPTLVAGIEGRTVTAFQKYGRLSLCSDGLEGKWEAPSSSWGDAWIDFYWSQRQHPLPLNGKGMGSQTRCSYPGLISEKIPHLFLEPIESVVGWTRVGKRIRAAFKSTLSSLEAGIQRRGSGFPLSLLKTAISPLFVTFMGSVLFAKAY